MPLILLNNWKIIAVSLTILATLGYVKYLKSELSSITLQLNQTQSALDYQNQSIIANKVDYERNLADSNKTNTVIQTRYKERKIYISTLGDSNESCIDAINNINHFTF
jgi:GTPase involved in cell partitioning and DNA repair